MKISSFLGRVRSRGRLVQGELLYSKQGYRWFSGFKGQRDSRGFDILPDGTHGTGGWMERRQLEVNRLLRTLLKLRGKQPFHCVDQHPAEIPEEQKQRPFCQELCFETPLNPILNLAAVFTPTGLGALFCCAVIASQGSLPACSKELRPVGGAEAGKGRELLPKGDDNGAWVQLCGGLSEIPLSRPPAGMQRHRRGAAAALHPAGFPG